MAALLAFLASSVVVAPTFASAKKVASFEAARLATMQAVKPTVRKVERGPGAAAMPCLFAPAPAWHTTIAAPARPASWTPPAKAHAELMVFLI